MDQAHDRRIGERRRGEERRRAERREDSGHQRVDRETVSPCFICGELALPQDSVAIPGAVNALALHPRCALRMTRDVMDVLQRSELGVVTAVSADEIKLSAREVQVLEGMVVGERDREIAQRLGVAEHTVKNYAYEIRHKLGARSRTQAAVQAVLLGLVNEVRPRSQEKTGQRKAAG